MTTSAIATEVARRTTRRARSDERMSMSLDLCRELRAHLEIATKIRFPTDRYRDDPVLFFQEILGVQPWSRQIEILEAVRDHDRVACKSGRRVSKSHTVAGLALWWYCSWPDARVIMSSTTARQVDQILWLELSKMRARAGRCIACKREDPSGFRIPSPCPHSAKIDGDIGQLARTGLKSEDFREVSGFTARQAEAVQGIAGSRLFFIIDEASGVPQVIFDAIEGNRAGGGKALLMGNPTRNTGEFFDAFHSKRRDPNQPDRTGYHCITISSEESPNVISGRKDIEGLATREYIREREQEWGRESAMFKIHVHGEFALAEEGRIFSVAALEESALRWHETEERGRLYIGLDPAGPSGTGDESCFAPRRGMKHLELLAKRGLNEEAHLVQLLALINRLRVPREVPVVVLDREGNVGAAVYGLFRAFLDSNPGAFELVGLRASDRAMRQPHIFDRMRDELAANLEAWMRDGGAILEDVKLTGELHTLEWKQQTNGRLKVTPKDLIRKAIGRSPDRYDALALSCWEPLSLREEAPTGRPAEAEGSAYDRPTSLDPYAGASPWGRR